MFDLLSIHIDAVVVVFRIHYKSAPFPPTGRNVRSIVFVQIFAKVTGSVAGIGEVSCKGPCLVRRLPLGARAIVVICEHHVIVNVHAGEKGRPGWTAHRCRCVSMSELCPTIAQESQSAWHEIQ